MRGKEERKRGGSEAARKGERRGQRRKNKTWDKAKSEEKSEKRGERAEARQRTAPPKRILAFPTPNHTARNPPP